MEWQNVLESIMYKFKTTNVQQKKTKHEHELMSYLWADQSIRKLVSLWLKHRYDKKECKSIERAQVLNTMGNQEFKKKNYLLSIQSYTKCALYAPINSNELSVAIANRSAALFYLNRYDECVKDINLAIKLNYPKNLHYKLYLRAVQCYLKLGKQKLAEQTLSTLHEIVNNPDYITLSIKDDIEKRISEITFNVSCTQNDTKDMSNLLKLKSEITFDENVDFLHASASIDKKYNQELGRYVVANRFIKKGEILFLEKPVSFVLLNYDALNSLCQHCNCLNTDIPIPCTKCLNTFYCDVNCSDQAWFSYHTWECPGNQMTLWKEIGIGHLALKVLLTCTTTTDMIQFNEMQNLVTNFDKLLIEDLTVYGITAIMLTIYLSEYTDFFKTNNLNDCLVKKFSDRSFNSNFNILTNNDKQLYVSSLLLRYILQLICNGHAIVTSNTLLNKNDSFMDQDIVGTGIYPSASMMNHSCDPNIINIFMDQYLIVRASKNIAKNEEIFNCYGPNYKHMSREQRQKILKSQYCFTCKCKHCTLPSLQYFVERFNAMKCLRCNGALCNIENSLCCLDCGDRSRIHQKNKLKQADKMFKNAQDLIDLGKMEEALGELKKCLYIRKTLLYKYNVDIIATLNLMETIYTTLDQWVNSIECLENTIIATIERFGSNSIELLNELNKLTDLCIMYLQKELDTTTDTYKTLLGRTHKYLDQLEELTNFHYGSWNRVCVEIKKKREKIYQM
ncbi:SET and MYND domain-containing protein 4-like isoform X1 [Hylaeus anthracinus]|uniref:SET and MYND domain-containing protein 4-like isoform X1 n=1 Tax=Hylaeus anthracinus TaxID=313031 RepID=UPI0023B8F979|nr:SET and MYND domain-containing protein 4-like isoform X1 [Hylaeus anthracinus]